ncbi:MAG: di-trans,poly-cis-decaprenylcistransferase [Actinobacteria bacterium]|jgi:short-chain Z-isoprenyl diphosphate synthase|nr:di-trans,poly-cis-decaprenylcistransferase [Actinomycetota bacterium]MBU1494446.1 di-trans,poly-cis-decaprenylcistransferase [Actinomycetota bacterium]MBU1865856.1 di-trans,poly-cis-decaprenylcistransferase [Actinomycetota bacterium]
MRPRDLLTRPLYRAYENQLLRGLDRSLLPQHIGVIHDGHRRFTRATGLPDYAAGYQRGMDKFLEFVGWCGELEVPAVTCWLLSKENLSRPESELVPYFDVLAGLFDRLPDSPGAKGVCIKAIGSLNLLPDDLRAAVERMVERSNGGERRVTIAVAYGGRQEIVDACRDLIVRLASEGIPAEEIAGHVEADALAAHLYTTDLPDPDLVIRTSGESRLSGFLLWQAAYAEYAFTDVYWPAFRRVDFLRALRDFTRRHRRFGQ